MGILRADPSSQIAAALEGWDYPLDRQGWMLADLIDVQGSSKAGKRWKSYPRPIKAKVEDANRKRIGDPSGRSRSEVVAILRALGHNVN